MASSSKLNSSSPIFRDHYTAAAGILLLNGEVSPTMVNVIVTLGRYLRTPCFRSLSKHQSAARYVAILDFHRCISVT